MYLPLGSDKASYYTDLVLFAESKQTFLLFWYHPILQYPLCLSEAFHERVDEAVELFSLTTTKTKIKSSPYLSTSMNAQMSANQLLFFCL